MPKEDEDVRMREDEAARRAEEEMQKLTDQVTQGEVVEEPEKDEKDETSESTGEPKTAPDGEPAASTPENDQDDSKQGLQKQDPPAKEEPESEKPLEEPKTDEKLSTAEEPDEVDQKIDKVQLRPGAHPKTLKALNAVKGIAKEEHKSRKQAESEAKTLRDEKATLKLLTPEIEAELNDHRAFRKHVDIEHDPEFNQKYADRITDLDKSALSILTADNLPASHRLPKTTADFINSNGGVLKFRSSQGYIPSGIKDPQGNLMAHEDGTPLTHREFWDKYIIPSMTPDQVDEINAISLESRQLVRERQQKLNEAKQNVEGWEKDRQEKGQAQQQEFTERFKKRAEAYAQSFGDVAMRKTVPTNATKEEKDVIDKHNARVDRAEGIARKYASGLTPESHAEMMLNSAYVETMREVDKEKDAKIGELTKRAEAAEKRVEDFKKAGQTAGKQSAPVHKQDKKETIYLQDSEDYMIRQMKEMGTA